MALFLFLLVAILSECLVVLYSLSLGIEDKGLVSTDNFPGTDWRVTLAISPLFHLVPVAVILALVSSWTYFTRHLIPRSSEAKKGKTGTAGKMAKEKAGFSYRMRASLLRIKSMAYVRSSFLIISLFLLLILTISLLAYPNLIHDVIAGAYETNPSLLNSIKGSGEAISSIGSVFSGINGAILSSSPGFRDFVLGLGSLIAPLANLDPAGKYLVFQNASAWISALTVLIYSEFRKKVRS